MTESPTSKRIFICPLDWGLGHAARMIPIVSEYLAKGHYVILGGSGKSGELLKSHFQNLPYISVPSYSVSYPVNNRYLFIWVFLQLPLFGLYFIKEHWALKKIITIHRIDTVISDNRYGLFSSRTHNIIVTHQISPSLPSYVRLLEYPLYLLIRLLISRFNECWIPDYDGKSNLTGKLSHRYSLPSNAKYIGPLSRFSLVRPNTQTECYDLVIVLSGPQPELSRFTQEIMNQVSGLTIKTLIITGLQRNIDLLTNKAITIVPDLDISHFKAILIQAGLIVCRSGYSTIMDLEVLKKSALLIPTSGQPEQQYLAKWLKDSGKFDFISQKELNLSKICEDYLRTKTTNINTNPRRYPI